MLCQECGKNTATMHFTKIVNGHVTEMHLCEACAKKHQEFELDNSFSFHKFLTGLLDNLQGEPPKQEPYNEITCDKCGMTYSKFKQVGKFGCAHCYEAFMEKIKPILKEVHGHDEHIGKMPKRAGGAIAIKKEINSLKDQLNILIKDEEFEKAAQVRDKIKILQEKIQEA